MSKPSICFLSRYSGFVNRGVESYVLELSERLKKDFDVSVFSGKDADNLSKIIKGNFQVVIPTNGRLQALKVSLGRPFGGYKVVISGQSGIGRDDIWNIAVVNPDVYVALTEHEYSWAKKWQLFSKIVKIPNGVDIDRFNSKGGRIKSDLKSPVVLSVGALDWYKHHEKVIEAVAQSANLSLLIVGTGPLHKNLEEMGIKMLGKERFKIGKMEYNQMPEVYRSADVFTLPSWDREAFGIVYLEALASNIPVVGPDDNSRREIIGSGGILVNVDDPVQYLNVLNQALDRKWNDLPRKQAEKFAWDKIAVEYKKLILSLT